MNPSHLTSLLVLCLVLASAFTPLHAAPKDHVVTLSATVSDSVPHITLNWTQQLQSNITAQKVHRRLKGETTWTLQATLTTTQTSYADNTALPEVEYEYWMERTLTIYPSPAIGYLSAGVKVPEVHDRGKLLLVIDSTMETPLAPEIAQLQLDLAADGWTVQQISAPRSGTAISTKALIKAAYDADPEKVKMVYVLGHVPVPYSGNFAPDGHGDHGGAWPADGYYGDMDGLWTDSTVNNTAAARTQNDNLPGDGKFDQSTLPGLVELPVGRVDLDRMNRAPSSSMTETTRLRRYLRRAHDYRHKQGAYADIPRRSIIRDGFGQFNGEAFATTGWSLAYTGVGQAPAAPIDEPPGLQWFLPAYAGGQSYLWGHANGAGGYESAQTFGNSTDLGHLSSRVVFTSIFGSYHGDWDADNNLMRAALAGNATGDNLGLVCFWAGRPRFFMHHLGMGETFGYGVQASMNGSISGGGGYTPPNNSASGVHIGLMGDPALRLHQVAPPRGLGATSTRGQVNLAWADSAESGLQGYHVYRATNTAGPFTRLTPAPQAGTTYADNAVTVGTAYTYLVRTLKLDGVPGGSYYNLSVGSPVTITASAAGAGAPLNPSELVITAQTSATNTQLAWQDNAGDETGYRVERKTGASGAYGTVGTLAAGATSFTDAGPFTQGNVYFYRVIATGAAGDSVPSNEVSFDALAGFIEFTVTKMKVNKTAGAATIAVKRFGGAVGSVGVSYSTANLQAVAGTHYAGTSGTLSWADGETGSKDLTVPLINTATPQLPRQFKVNLSAPTGGSGLAQWTALAVLIEDPTATLDAPWQQTLLGGITESSPAVSAEGVIGDATMGGSTGNSEAGRFLYQSRTGDGVITAYVPDGVPLQGSAYIAVMVRATTANNTFSAATFVQSNHGGSYGSKLSCRTAVGSLATVTPSADNNLETPRWIRLTRIGNTFLGEVSADGTTWVTLGSATVASMPATALWGIFHFSNDWASGSTYLGDFQLATFQNITIEDFATLPGVPDGAALSYYNGTGAAHEDPSSITLSWTADSYAAGYRIERRGDDGSLDLFDIPFGTTTSYDDFTFAPDTAYQYRIQAYNSVGDGGWSATQRLTTAGANRTITLTTADAGGADASVSADMPDTTFGTQDSVWAGNAGGVVTTTNKAYFRFDLSSLPAYAFMTIDFKLTVLGSQGVSGSTFFNGNTFLLASESSDVWDESAITWNNAPQNNTAGTTFLAPTRSLGNFIVFQNPPTNGSVTEITVYNPADILDNKGANNRVTLGIRNAAPGTSMTYASREHATAAPPTLVFTYSPPEPLRPGFLTATPGAGSGFDLTWTDNSADETGFQLERRAANGDWTLLATLAADATGYTGTTALPGIIYEYRLRAGNAAGSSSWATSASILHAGVATINNPVRSADSVTFNQVDAAPGNGYVPAGFMYYPPTKNFVTSQTLSTTKRNNSGSRLGMKFTTGANPLIIRELGRWVISGNAGTHTVKLVVAGTDADVPGGAVSIATAAAPVGYKFVALDAPLTLAANTAYYLVSQETSGGDEWYEANNTLTYPGTVATVNNAVYSSGATYVAAYSANNCYGPLSFRYSLSALPFATGHSMTTLRNDYTGWLGIKLTTGAAAALVDQLSRWVVPGNTGAHTVKLVDALTGADIASVSVPTLGVPGGQFAYASLAAPVTLAANASYYLLSQETAGGDHWFDFARPAPGTATGYQYWLLANGLPMDASGSGSATASPSGDGLSNLMKYALGLDPAGRGSAGRLSYGTATDAGSDYFTLIYTRPEPASAGITYLVESSPDLTDPSWSSAGLVEVSSVVNAGLRTITIRNATPMTSGPRGFMRLKVTLP